MLQPNPTVELFRPVANALAEALARLTDVTLDEAAQAELISAVITQRYWSHRDPSPNVSYVGVLFHHQDGPSATITLTDKQPAVMLNQQITSSLTTAWYGAIGESPRHAIAREAVRALCAHLESKGWDPIDQALHELMANAMVASHLVSIPITKGDWRRANLTLLNVSGRPTVMLYGPEHMKLESEAADYIVYEIVVGLW